MHPAGRQFLRILKQRFSTRVENGHSTRGAAAAWERGDQRETRANRKSARCPPPCAQGSPKVKGWGSPIPQAPRGPRGAGRAEVYTLHRVAGNRSVNRASASPSGKWAHDWSPLPDGRGHWPRGTRRPAQRGTRSERPVQPTVAAVTASSPAPAARRAPTARTGRQRGALRPQDTPSSAGDPIPPPGLPGERTRLAPTPARARPISQGEPRGSGEGARGTRTARQPAGVAPGPGTRGDDAPVPALACAASHSLQQPSRLRPGGSGFGCSRCPHFTSQPAPAAVSRPDDAMGALE